MRISLFCVRQEALCLLCFCCKQLLGKQCDGKIPALTHLT